MKSRKIKLICWVLLFSLMDPRFSLASISSKKETIHHIALLPEEADELSIENIRDYNEERNRLRTSWNDLGVDLSLVVPVVFNRMSKLIQSRATLACRKYKGGQATTIENVELQTVFLKKEDFELPSSVYVMGNERVPSEDAVEGLYFILKPDTVTCQVGLFSEEKLSILMNR